MLTREYPADAFAVSPPGGLSARAAALKSPPCSSSAYTANGLYPTLASNSVLVLKT
jgi:hypothetical protein